MLTPVPKHWQTAVHPADPRHVPDPQAFIKDAKNMPTGAGQLRFEKAEVMHEASSTENTVAKVKVRRFHVCVCVAGGVCVRSCISIGR